MTDPLTILFWLLMSPILGAAAILVAVGTVSVWYFAYLVLTGK